MKKISDAEVQHMMNPRPDLTEDVDLWARLLLKAYALDGQIRNGLFWTLHGFRCLGAHLRMGKSSAILEKGEISEQEYAALKAKWLEPFREQLIKLLAELAVAVPGQGMAA